MSTEREGDIVRVVIEGEVVSAHGRLLDISGGHSVILDNVVSVEVLRPPVKVGDVIETAEQLDALPVGSVVREVAHRVPADICPDVCERWASGWYSTGTASDVRPALPTTVLYLPDGAA